MRFIENLDARLLFDAGAPDVTFGDHGVVTIDVSSLLAPGDTSFVIDAQEDAFGNVYVLGADRAPDFEQKQIFISRFDAYGKPDTRFGTNGILAIERINNQSPEIEVDTFGRVFLRDDERLYRFTRFGKFDRAFGRRGKVMTAPAGLGRSFDFELDAAGRVYLFGTAGSVTRLQADGSPDLAWADGGTYRAAPAAPNGADPFSHNAKAGRVLADGKVVVAIEEQYDTPDPDDAAKTIRTRLVKAIRLTPDGSLDATYGTDGIVINAGSDDDDLTRVMLLNGVLADGSVLGQEIVIDDSTDERTSSMFRVPADGKSITSSARYIPAVERAADRSTSYPYVLQDDGRLVAAYGANVYRMRGDGVPDASWGQDGVVRVPDGRRARIARDGSVFVLTGDEDGPPRIVKLLAGDAPTGQLTAVRSPRRSAGSSLAFKITWRDDDGVDGSSIGDRDVYVRLPDGTRRSVRLAATRQLSSGSFEATYKLTSADGSWGASDSGRFEIVARRDEIRDASDVFNGVRTIGCFDLSFK